MLEGLDPFLLHFFASKQRIKYKGKIISLGKSWDRKTNFQVLEIPRVRSPESLSLLIITSAVRESQHKHTHVEVDTWKKPQL